MIENAEAIRRIQTHMRVHKMGEYPHELIKEALDMAIDALREQEERESRKPLTLDELRQMDGEPVWIDDWFEDFHGWELSEDASDYFDGDSRTVESYGTRWEAYRSKPKEDSK